MIAGLDLTPTYPYLALFGFILIFVIVLVGLWRLSRGLGKTGSVLGQVAKQVGSNGDSTLRTELTRQTKRTEEVYTLLLEKIKTNDGMVEELAKLLSAHKVALTQMDGMIAILGKTMNDMGLSNQMRSLVEAYVKKDIATTNLSVVQANAQTERHGGIEVSGGTLSAGASVIGGDEKVGGDQTQGDKTIQVTGKEIP